MPVGYIIVGKHAIGPCKGQETMIGSLRHDGMAMTKEMAEENLQKAKKYFQNIQNPPIDPDSLRILDVVEPGNSINL